jgi:hypothetical protein
VEERIEYFERMPADNPDNPTSLLANGYGKVGRHEDEAAVLERDVATHERERTARQHALQVRFRALLTGKAIEVELV